jgi:hypothetical protein
VIDTRREAAHIEKEFSRYQGKIGETVIWFRFDTENSHYSGTYDEGGRAYLPGVALPILWVDQIEAPEQYVPEGKRPVQGLRFAASAKAIYEIGLSDREAHGHRLWDTGLINDTWFDDRSNDICYYNGRYYEISNFQIRGRAREDVIVGVTCTETYIEDEYVFDYSPPGSPIPPPPTPVAFTIIVTPDPSNPYGYGFQVTDDPNHHVDWDYGDGTSENDVLCSETVEHVYDNAGNYIVTAFCHHETITTEVEVAPGPGYGMGQYGLVQPYGGYAYINPLEDA